MLVRRVFHEEMVCRGFTGCGKMRLSQNSPAGTEGNSPGRKSWVRRRRECEVPLGRHKDLSSPGDLSCAVNSTQDLRPGLFPSVLPDCSVTSAFFRSLFSPCWKAPYSLSLTVSEM